MARIIMHGASGRMGRRIVELALGDARFDSICPMNRADPLDAVPREPAGDTVVVDFSAPSALERAVRLADRLEAPLLVGTTGLEAAQNFLLDDLAQRVAVMLAPNTSLGVAVLAHLAREAARLLPPDFDVEIVELHHRRKKDAPSGTALRLARAVEAGRGRSLDGDRIHAVRAGDIVGEHEIVLAGQGQVLRLGHRAESRDVFASGALHAAAWLLGRAPGRYAIEDALGLGGSA